MAILRHSRIVLTVEVCTQVPDKTTRDTLKWLRDLLGSPWDAAADAAQPPAGTVPLAPWAGFAALVGHAVLCLDRRSALGQPATACT